MFTPRKYFLHVLGCQMNYADAERVAAVLGANGFEATTDFEEADVYLFVTCSVRQKAEDRVYGFLEKLHAWKARRSRRQVGITGCMVRHTSAQTDSKRDQLLVRFPTVDFVWRIEDTGELRIKNEELRIQGRGSRDEGQEDEEGIKNKASEALNPTTYNLTPNSYFSIPPLPKNRFQVSVPIMTGCDNWCTYCVVPLARGREYSRPPEEILTECEAAIRNGAREITLLGQNVNSYQKTRGAFAELLARVAEIPGLARLRFSSSHPKDFDDSVIDVMARHANIEQHLHLPAQHGDDEILRRMNRNYTAREYLALIQKFRKSLPDASVTTDLIVGFPGETEQYFENLLAFYRAADFEFAFFAKYSPRVGTAAADFPETVSEKIKTERWKQLNALVIGITQKKYARQKDRTLHVLVERCARGVCEGRSAEYFLVKFPGDATLIGKIVSVKITMPREVELRGTKE